MDLQDSSIQGVKIYRDTTASVQNDLKSTQQGVEVTAQSDTTGKYTVARGGDEQGWLYTPPASAAYRNNLGSYCQSYPAILNTDDKIVPILDKTLAVDENYAEKEQSSDDGDSVTAVRVAEETADGTPGIVVTCLNHAAQEQIFFPISGNIIFYARVRWNFTSTDGDLSEGELLSYDSDTDAFSASGTAIWIDTAKSAQCQFRSAGDGTAFVVKLVKRAVTRDSVERDLYYCSQCIKDDGYEITHFKKIAKAGDNFLDVNFLSDEIADPPWELTNCKIYTTIISTASENILIVKVPSDWDAGTSSIANWDYTEISDLSKGVFFLAKPIRPRLTDADTLQWESVEYYDSSTIASYQSV